MRRGAYGVKYFFWCTSKYFYEIKYRFVCIFHLVIVLILQCKDAIGRVLKK